MAGSGATGAGPRSEVRAALARQRARDLLGPDEPEAHLAHSEGFAAAAPGVPGRVVDLGSGGGVPGLVLAALAWPAAEVTLVDASQRRCTYLELEVGRLGLAPRVEVRWARAEELGADPAWRQSRDLVVARSFGPPAATAECAAPLLEVGGHLVVSEPPGEDGDRWRHPALAELGLDLVSVVDGGTATYAVLAQVAPCPPRYPRRPGVPARSPLF